MAMELNPIAETLFLLMISKWNDEEKTKTIDSLAALGINGEDFYKRHFDVVEKYYAAFQKNKIVSAGTKLLEKVDEYTLSVYTHLFRKHSEWVDIITDIADDELKAEVLQALADLTEEQDDFMSALDSLELSAEAKWQLMLLKEKPRQQLELIAAAIRENMQAFETAKTKVFSELRELLAAAEARISSPDKSRFLQISYQISPDKPIIPTLALPVAVAVVDDVSFYGLLCDYIIEGGAAFSKAELVVGAKALSEQSKVDILLALKDATLYNNEIAEKVGLTSATVSHHMNDLLNTGFVEAERRDRKLYYKLSPNNIQQFLTGVGQILLK